MSFHSPLKVFERKKYKKLWKINDDNSIICQLKSFVYALKLLTDVKEHKKL